MQLDTDARAVPHHANICVADVLEHGPGLCHSYSKRVEACGILESSIVFFCIQKKSICMCNMKS